MIISNEITVNGNIEMETTEEERENEFVKIIITKVNGIKTQSDKYTKNSIIDNYQLSCCFRHYSSGNNKEHWGYTNGLLRTQNYFNNNKVIFEIHYAAYNNLQVVVKYYNDPCTEFSGKRFFNENGNIIRESIKSSDNANIDKVISYVDIDDIWDGIPRIAYYDMFNIMEVKVVEEPIDGPLWVLPDHDLYVFENASRSVEA
jgi:hypothetical protein